MLDVVIRFLAHVLTPLFLFGMAGSLLLVVTKFGSDVIEFFRDDNVDNASKTNGKPNAKPVV